MTDTRYVGRHRKTSAAEHRIHHIVTKSVFAGNLNNGTLYVSLTDAVTGNGLGIDFEARAVDSLRRVLRASS
jgi:hypothetical protein